MGIGQTTGLCVALALMALTGLDARAASPLVEAAAVALRAGNASNAIALANQALQDASLTQRDRARVLLDRGLAHELLGERDGAFVDFTEAINARVLPAAEQARAFYDRGVTLDELGRTDEALKDYTASIGLDSRFAAALNNRGNAYRRLALLSEARADYLASLAAGNTHAEYPNFGLGLISEAQGQSAAARAYYQAALAANPQFSLAVERLAAMGPAPAGFPVTLTPPRRRPVRLRPPKPGVAQLPAPPAHALASPDLKPAFSETAAPAAGAVQLGAWRSEAEAADAWNRIARRGGDLLAGFSPQVVPVELPGKGRYYRLRAGPVTPDAAPGLCAALHAKRLECMVATD